MRPRCQKINVTDLRVATREILENAHFRGQHYVVERAGQPMVAILSIDEYQRLISQGSGEEGLGVKRECS